MGSSEPDAIDRSPLKWPGEDHAEVSHTLSQTAYSHPLTSSMPNNSKDDLWDVAFSNVGRKPESGRRRRNSEVSQAIQAISGVAVAPTHNGSNNTGGTAVSSSTMPTSGSSNQGTTANISTPQYSDYPASHGIPGRRARPKPGSNQPWRASGHS
ncbi:hypothetical protein BJV78DRAFT_561288 [Lactifluus subvellereus]|nr:hypothetical protein BJV78DRAFT_561288 [Lactifluus subvellereus]